VTDDVPASIDPVPTLPKRPSSPENGCPLWIGKYEVVAALEVGKTREVLLARAHGPHGFARVVVLKRLRTRRVHSAALVADLVNEAEAYARLEHPTIVRMYDFFEHEGAAVLVLEYVNGMSLRCLLDRLRLRGKSLGDAAAIFVMQQVFSALSVAHEARSAGGDEPACVVHRDVTPKNVLIGWDGRVKLADFGIAKLAGVPGDTESAGLIKGTFGYMAPEQILSKKATARTDVYTACLVLRELLLGKATFIRGDESEDAYLERLACPSIPDIGTLRKGVPRTVRKILLAGLRPDADRRTLSASEVRGQLARLIDVRRARAELAAMMELARAPEPPAGPPSGGRSSFGGITRDNPAPSPPRMRWTLLAIACCALAMLGRPWAAQRLQPTAAPPSVASSPVPGVPTPPSDDGESGRQEPPVEPVAPPVPSTLGEIRTARDRWSHRIFVDGRVLGETGQPLRVACGLHDVRVGSQGKLQRVDVPCGGYVAVSPVW
jgi:serine/threonine protein kinase